MNARMRWRARRVGPALLFVLVVLGVGPLAAQDRGPPSPAEVVELLQEPETLDEGTVELARLAGTLPPELATRWVQLLALSRSVRPDWTAAAAQAVLLAHDGEDAAALERIRRLAVDAEAEEDEAPLLSLAAMLADPVDATEAATFRERIVERWPEAREAPEAFLHLARHLLSDPDQAPRGLSLLEELLVRRPAHPVAPEARRLRQEALLRGVAPGADEPDPQYPR